MSREAVLRRLEPIFRSVIDPDLMLTEELDASKVPLSESLNHIILVVEIEMQLGVALTTDELANLRNVSELVTLLQRTGRTRMTPRASPHERRWRSARDACRALRRGANVAATRRLRARL